MAGTSWDELIHSLPPVPEESAPDSPVRTYERLAHAQRELVEALRLQPPADQVLDLLERGLADPPSATLVEGGVIAEGWNAELDERST